MAVGKEIRTKINSVKSTQKITSAMEMVAASKMRGAQVLMNQARPYADKIAAVVAHLSQSHPEYKHPFMVNREVKRVGYIVVTSDRGLCGGLNTNLLKTCLADMRKWHDQGIEADVSVIGSKGTSFFTRVGGNIVSEASAIGDKPHISDLIGMIKVQLDAYNDGKIDRLFLVNNQFVNTMIQTPTISQLLPLQGADDEELKHHWDYIYEPDPKDVVDALLTRFIESTVYRGVVENLAAEQASRMVAMKSATDNAGNIIDELEVIYNKARQASITQEISEIVAGAAAV